MFHLVNFESASAFGAAGAQALTAGASCHGRDRRDPVPRQTPSWFAATLDELDYGVVLLGADLQTVHVNHAARTELDAPHPLQWLGGELRARQPGDATRLAEALQAAARRGFRKQLALGSDGQRVVVSIVPLPTTPEADTPVILVMLGKRRDTDVLPRQAFATCHRLTASEAQVLTALCQGAAPTEIAAQSGVAISTVRTHISSIRLKTGARSIRALLQQVASLPPLRSVLREAAGRHSAPSSRLVA